MNKDTRNAIEKATQRARTLLEGDFFSQLEGTFDVLRNGVVSPSGGPHLSARQEFQRAKIVATIEHKRAAGMTAAEAVVDYVRDAAFTTLNRFVALKMLEARELVQECITMGDQSAGYREYCGLAPAVALLPDAFGYRLYVESLFDELATEVKVLFDRRDAGSFLWPKRQPFEALLEVLNAKALDDVWSEDETIGWVYQFFNSGDERKRMRDESPSPRNSRELAVRNQFFTPRYVVQFLTDNTLGRTWLQMRRGKSALADRCSYVVRGADDTAPRSLKDPRDLKILDPACGSGHFLLYAFELLLTIYEEAWADPTGGIASEETGRSLRDDYPDLASLRRAVPALVVQHNLYGVDIDPRAAQIAALALWLRAQRAFYDFDVPAQERTSISSTHIIVAEPMPGDVSMLEEFASGLEPPLLRDLFKKMIGEMRLAGELGTLLRVEDGIAAELEHAREQFVAQQRTTGYLPELGPLRRQGELNLSGIDSAQFFHEAEARIVDALRRFAESSAGSSGVRRRLFSGDAVQGIALIDLLRTRFDVVVMNPPFGDSRREVRDRLKEDYPLGRPDLYACFAFRAAELAGPGGCVGAITSRTFQTLEFFARLRKAMLSDEIGLTVLADLGSGVLDGATVETSAWICHPASNTSRVTFLRLDDVDPLDKQTVLNEIVAGGRADRVFIREHSAMLNVPAGAFAYWLPPELLRLFAAYPPLDSTVAAAPLSGVREARVRVWARVRQGLIPGDLWRFTRLYSEVTDAAGVMSPSWVPLAKGGDFSRFAGPELLTILWQDGGREIKAFAEQRYGGASRTIKNEIEFFRAGLTFPRVSSVGLNVRLLPPGFIFSDTGMAVLPEDDDNRVGLLGYLNSRLADTLCAALHPGRKFEIAHVAALPVPIDALQNSRIKLLAGELHRLSHLLWSMDLGSPLAKLDVVVGVAESFDHLVGAIREKFIDLWCEVATKQQELDAEIFDSFGVSQASRDVCRDRVHNLRDGQSDSPRIGATLYPEHLTRDRVERHAPSSREVAQRVICDLCREGLAQMPAKRAVLDDGHADDLVKLLHRTAPLGLQTHWPQIEAALGKSVAEYCRDDLFADILQLFTSGGRIGPPVVSIATRSAKYSIWFLAQESRPDLLFALQSDILNHKLAFEETRLAQLRQEVGESPTAAERGRLAEQADLIEELAWFRTQVKLLAPLWRPDQNDGVVITMAPLWSLGPQNTPWQKELKATWEALCAGTYDWTHMAMRLWPERVVPECATDRSLAIAHGLEDVFWVQGVGGKWKQRSLPTRPVAELVHERTSSAVKDVLKDVLDAPVPSTGVRRGRRGAIPGI